MDESSQCLQLKQEHKEIKKTVKNLREAKHDKLVRPLALKNSLKFDTSELLCIIILSSTRSKYYQIPDSIYSPLIDAVNIQKHK